MRFLEAAWALTLHTIIARQQTNCRPRLGQLHYIFMSINSGSVLNKGVELMITATRGNENQLGFDIELAGNRGTLGEFMEGVDLFYVTDVQIGGVKAARPNGGIFGYYRDYWMRETMKMQMEDVENPNGRYVVDETKGYKTTGVIPTLG